MASTDRPRADLVDEQQARPAQTGHGQAEQVLLAAGQVPG